MSGDVGAEVALTEKEWDALLDSWSCDYCEPEKSGLREEFNALIAVRVEAARAEVADAFVAWAAKNEIAGPPLDWAWFGEITRRYSPLHEDRAAALDPGQPR